MSCPFVAIQNALEKQRTNEMSIHGDGNYSLRCPISGRGAPASYRPTTGNDFPSSNDFGEGPSSPKLRAMDRYRGLGAIIEDECDIECESLEKMKAVERSGMERCSPASQSPRGRVSSPIGRFLNRDGSESHASGRSMSIAGSTTGIEVHMAGSRYCSRFGVYFRA